MVNNSISELEKLEIVLNKKPIIGTWTAQDLLDRPEMVRENYLQHVRSFVLLKQPMAKTENNQPTVEEYEKRLVRLVREGGAAKGTITGEFGYGKTSTALFVWNQCELSNIVTVPPFQIQQLHHLISATYGWVRYKLSLNYPALVVEADRIYQKYVAQDIERHGETEEVRKALAKAYQEGRYSLDLRPPDYIRYFEEMTALVQQANFSGLVVIADELQQYIEPSIRAGQKEPIAPLFDIVQALMVRKGQMAFALIFSVPTKEWGVINDQRGDLVQRLQSDRLALDLGSVYQPSFARQLWHQLAQELDFETLRDRIVAPHTLESLGQISARPDLAVGPRTVVNVFNLMTQRFKEQPDNTTPFSPLDLIEAFLSGQISYDNTSKLQQVVNSHLAHSFVQNKLNYQKAIKLMAAFPMEGLPESYFDFYNVRQTLDALTREAQGDVITYLGGGYGEDGHKRELRAMLVGLEERKLNTDWLTNTLREFVRNIPEGSQRSLSLIVKGFGQLLQTEIFKSGNWSLQSSLDSTFTQNRAYIFKGAFNTTLRHYPSRIIHVRVLTKTDVLRDQEIQGDLALNFDLKLYDEKPEQEKRYIAGEVSSSEKRTLTFILNLNHNSGKESYGDLNNTLLPLVSPWKITPALLLSLYAYLEEKRAANVIPLAEDEVIRSHFQPILLEHALNELFNPELGQSYKAAGPKIVEEAVRRLLEISYPDYKTFISNQHWKKDLREYLGALNNLPTPFIRQGQELYTAGKSDLAAKIFNKTNSLLDNYVATNSSLIKAEGSNYRFLLHPLEDVILTQLKNSPLPPKLTGVGGKARNWIKRTISLKIAEEKGYREEEFETATQLLEARGLISFNPSRTEIIQEVAKIPSVTELHESLQAYAERLNHLRPLLPDNSQLTTWYNELIGFKQIVEHLVKNPDEVRQTSLAATIKNRMQSLDAIIKDNTSRLVSSLANMGKQGIAAPLNEKVLVTPSEKGLFSLQLEAQREHLLKEVTSVTGVLEPLKDRLFNIFHLAEQETLDDDDFEQLITQEKQIRTDVFRQQQRHAELNKILGSYEQARRLLGEAQRFGQGLQSGPPSLRAGFEEQLQVWANDITASLSSQKLNGLSQQDEWRERFERLDGEFKQQIKADRERFSSIQADYRQFAVTHFPKVSIWAEIIYNQTEPHDSYNRLWEAVHEVFKQALKLINLEVQGIYDRATRLKGGGIATLISSVQIPARLKLDNLLPELAEYRISTANMVVKVNEASFMDRVREQGATTNADKMLQPVLKNIRRLTEKLSQHSQSIVELEEQVKQAKLSPQEEWLLQNVTDLWNDNNHTGVELGSLLQRLTPGNEGFKWPWDKTLTDGFSLEEQWSLLAKLYPKGRLQIRIAPVDLEVPTEEQ